MEETELEYVLRKALRREFDRSDKYSQIEIYKAFKELNNKFKMNFEEDIAEARSDIYSDHRIELT